MLKYATLLLSLLAIPTAVLASEKDQPASPSSNIPQTPLTKKQIEEREEASMAKAEAAHHHRIDLYQKALRKEEGAHAQFVQEALENSWLNEYFKPYDQGELMGFDFGTHPAGTPLGEHPINTLTENDLLVIYWSIIKEKLSKDLWELLFQKQTLNPKDPNVQYLLGKSYMYGLGCDRDPEKAFANINMAALQGNQHAKLTLIQAYYQGTPSPFLKNPTLAFGMAEMLTKECKNPWLYANFGMFYLQGSGIEKNLEQALTYLRLAAEQGDPYSQFWFGKMYWEGTGAPQNMGLGLKWFGIAANQGNTQAKDMLQRLQSVTSWPTPKTKATPSERGTLSPSPSSSSSTATSVTRPVNITLPVAPPSTTSPVPQNLQSFNPSYLSGQPAQHSYQIPPYSYQVWYPGNPSAPSYTNSYGPETFPGVAVSSSHMPSHLQPQNVASGASSASPSQWYKVEPMVEGRKSYFKFIDPTQAPPPSAPVSTGAKRSREDDSGENRETKRQHIEQKSSENGESDEEDESASDGSDA